MKRRGFLQALGVMAAVPVIAKLEPLIALPETKSLLTPEEITREALRLLNQKLAFLNAVNMGNVRELPYYNINTDSFHIRTDVIVGTHSGIDENSGADLYEATTQYTIDSHLPNPRDDDMRYHDMTYEMRMTDIRPAILERLNEKLKANHAGQQIILIAPPIPAGYVEPFKLRHA